MPDEVVGRWCPLFPTREVFQWETLHAKGKGKKKVGTGTETNPKNQKVTKNDESVASRGATEEKT